MLQNYMFLENTTICLKAIKKLLKKSKSQKDAVIFIKQKLDAAKWFIDAIKQRQQTLIDNHECDHASSI